jgi:hypothetical protein
MVLIRGWQCFLSAPGRGSGNEPRFPFKVSLKDGSSPFYFQRTKEHWPPIKPGLSALSEQFPNSNGAATVRCGGMVVKAAQYVRVLAAAWLFIVQDLTQFSTARHTQEARQSFEQRQFLCHNVYA